MRVGGALGEGEGRSGTYRLQGGVRLVSALVGQVGLPVERDGVLCVARRVVEGSKQLVSDRPEYQLLYSARE